MHFTFLNTASALAIGVTIGLMASIQDLKLKATLYSLPIPITIALIATHGVVTSANIIGLLLLCAFLSSAFYLHEKLGTSIILSDIISAIGYVIVGYFAIKLIKFSFETTCLIYLFLWLILVSWLIKNRVKLKPIKPSSLSPYAKGIGTSIISFILFNLKSLLFGIVVTFPFSGVFAVLETRSHLNLLSRTFFRNSLAILGLFIVVYNLRGHLSLVISLAIGWVVYLAILGLINKVSV